MVRTSNWFKVCDDFFFKQWNEMDTKSRTIMKRKYAKLEKKWPPQLRNLVPIPKLSLANYVGIKLGYH